MMILTFWLAALGASAEAESSASRVQATAPASWSPDGRWIAYLLATRPPDQALPPGWLLDGRPALRHLVGNPDAPRRLRLWASRPDTGDHVLLDESDHPIGSPSWAPGGHALAYVRVVPGEGDDPPALEVVIQEEPGTPRSLHREPLRGVDPDRIAALTGAPVAWSPDGRHLAVPRVAPAGLEVLRADRGRPLKTLPGASSPVWSPDGSRLAFVRVGPTGEGSLGILETNFEEPRILSSIPEAARLGGPVWSRDGRSILVVRSSREEARIPGRIGAVATQRLRLERIELATGEAIPVQEFTLQPIEASDVLHSASFAINADQSHLFFVTNSREQVSQITWAQPLREMIQVRFNPVDPAASLHALALEPEGRRLAFRADSPGPDGPLALCDPATQKMTPIVPDDSARVEWLALLANHALGTIAGLPDPVDAQGIAVERMTFLPAPDEIGPQAPGMTRLRYLARVAGPLCETAPDHSTPDATLTRALDEARFVFDYLRFDESGANYRAARESLARLDRFARTPAERLRWLGLHAQVDVGLGELDRARLLVEHLRDSTPWPTDQVEDTPRGPVLVPLFDPDRAWLDTLAFQIATRQAEGSAPDADPNALLVPSASRPLIGPIESLPPQPGLAPDPDGRIDDVRIPVRP